MDALLEGAIERVPALVVMAVMVYYFIDYVKSRDKSQGDAFDNFQKSLALQQKGFTDVLERKEVESNRMADVCHAVQEKGHRVIEEVSTRLGENTIAHTRMCEIMGKIDIKIIQAGSSSQHSAGD